MGKEFFDTYKSAHSVFEEADDALGFSIKDIIFNGTPEELAKTTITQPAILTVSIAALKALEEELGTELSPACVAGHSLGEYTSLVATGMISLADGVRLLHLRGALMQQAVPIGTGAMAAIVGMEPCEVNEICVKAAQGEVCKEANINSPNQIVISGHCTAIARAVELIEAIGNIRVVPLRVSAPFHCELMRCVADKLKVAFAEIKWKTPKCPIVVNVSAKAMTSIDDIKDALFKQTFSPVMWYQSVLKMETFDTEGYIELGPGSVLSGLVRKITNTKKPYHVSGVEELLLAASFLKGETK
ncbi:MAG: ACP S-malonyltransferase [Synergistaceae bacterium]|nr:ACP S-malonyltransferase [Synergistaceae bacterium]